MYAINVDLLLYQVTDPVIPLFHVFLNPVFQIVKQDGFDSLWEVKDLFMILIRKISKK